MLRIFNKKLINSKKIIYSLINLYGINIFQSKKICKYVGINQNIKTINLKIYHTNRLKNYIKKNIIIEHFLKEKEKKNKNFLLEIKNIRGIRQHFGLPIRGQRTHSNAKTSKKNKYEKK
jgi:small subunit ribosomal protein S13